MLINMKYKDSISAKCRYGELVEKIYGGWDLLFEESEDGYSGKVYFIIQNPITKFVKIYNYYYGSCSVCDEWEGEDLNDESIIKIIEGDMLCLSEEEYEKFKVRLARNDTNFIEMDDVKKALADKEQP